MSCRLEERACEFSGEQGDSFKAVCSFTAMAGQIYEVQLEGGGPWGFRLQGGKDFGQPLIIAKITPGGKASNCGVNQGETILEIANHSTEEMTHFDAQNAIRRAGQTLQLRLQRTSKAEGKTLVVTETVHSAKVDHKYNAVPKPFGQSSPTPSHQPVQANPPASSTARKIPQAQAPPTMRTGPPGVNPVAPAAPAHRGPPARPMNNVHTRDMADGHSHVNRTQHVEDEDLVNRFKFNISDDGDVEQEHWGHPPDPNVQSKSFKNLMKHLDHEGTEDFPPPPPEAFQPEEEEDNKQVQSRSFKFLQDTVSSGEAAPSVFSRATEDRSKPSTTPLPPMYRPKPPVIRPAVQIRPVGNSPVAGRPGQPQPVALPGMVQMAPVQSSPSRAPSSPPHNAPSSARTPSSPTGQQEIKRSPIKPGGSQPVPEGTRTPYCAGCGEEIFGPFASAIGKTWHPDHFVCDVCGVSLQYQGFMEEEGKVYCESDYNRFFAPHCATCKQPIAGQCLKAIDKNYHPQCFICTSCEKPIGSEGFNVDRGNPYCEGCYKRLFCVKCSACNLAIGGGERWVEALDKPWHASCFKCEVCNKNLEGNQFYSYGGKPYCVLHGAP